MLRKKPSTAQAEAAEQPSAGIPKGGNIAISMARPRRRISTHSIIQKNETGPG